MIDGPCGQHAVRGPARHPGHARPICVHWNVGRCPKTMTVLRNEVWTHSPTTIRYVPAIEGSRVRDVCQHGGLCFLKMGGRRLCEWKEGEMVTTIPKGGPRGDNDLVRLTEQDHVHEGVFNPCNCLLYAGGKDGADLLSGQGSREDHLKMNLFRTKWDALSPWTRWEILWRSSHLQISFACVLEHGCRQWPRNSGLEEGPLEQHSGVFLEVWGGRHQCDKIY